MKGEKSVSSLIKLSESGKKKMKRRAIKPKDCAFISPFECLNGIVKKYDTPIFDMSSMCISFILKSTDEINIKGNSSAEIMTNHIFTKRRKRKRKKEDSGELTAQERELNEVESQLAYHLTNEGQLPLLGIFLDPRQSQLKHKMDKQFSIKLFNFNSEDFKIQSNSIICKIYIYVLEKEQQEEN